MIGFRDQFYERKNIMKSMFKESNVSFVPKIRPLKLSRSKLELFINCKRCFYLDVKLKIKRPNGFPFTLNNAVDTLLKKEFDLYRAAQKPHPILIKNGIYAVPFAHEKLDEWRNRFQGIRYNIPGININFGGAIDDVWIDLKTQELIIVDYKATSKKDVVTLDADWQVSYKRQMEIYQWLFRKNGFDVAGTGYFVYCNGKKDVPFFNNQLNFDISLLPYSAEDNSDWIEKAILNVYECMQSDVVPLQNKECKYCSFCAQQQSISIRGN